MKIVFLQDDFPPQTFGGAGFSTYELAQGMRAAGHDVSIITTSRKEDDTGESNYQGLRVFTIVSNYSGRWRSYVSLNNRMVVRQVGKILEQLRPDIVHANNVHAHLSWASLKAAKKYARGVVWTARDVMSFNYGKLITKRYLDTLYARTTWRDHIQQAGKRWNPLRNWLIRYYLAYADMKCAVSDALARALEQNGIAPVVTVHTGIDVGAWHTSEQEAWAFRARHGLEKKRVIFFGGRLNAVGQALEGFAGVVKKMPDAALLIAGKEDAFVEAIKADARRLGIDKHLVWTGWLAGKELKAAYAASDVVLVPSAYFDSLPRVVLEGMAVGKPVVATHYGGAAEAIVEGKTGHVIDPRNSDQMVEKLVKVLADLEAAKAMGRAGQERIRTEFSMEQMVKGYVSHYTRILSQ